MCTKVKLGLTNEETLVFSRREHFLLKKLSKFESDSCLVSSLLTVVTTIHAHISYSLPSEHSFFFPSSPPAVIMEIFLCHTGDGQGKYYVSRHL